MKYILLIYGDERVWAEMSREQMEQVMAGHRAYGAEMTRAGVTWDGSELQRVATATSVKFSKGQSKTVDGPFAETKEQLAGYYVIDVDNLEQAIGWAEKMPGMAEGTVEVRPLG